MLDDIGGENPCFLRGRTIQAQHLQLPPSTGREWLHDVAASLPYLSRAWSGSVLSAFVTEVNLGTLEPVFGATYLLYDETPLALRNAGASTPLSNMAVQDVSDLPSKSAQRLGRSRKEKGMTNSYLE